METLRSWGFDYTLNGFPVVVLIGLATYALFALTAVLTSLKRWSRALLASGSIMPIRDSG